MIDEVQVHARSDTGWMHDAPALGWASDATSSGRKAFNAAWLRFTGRSLQQERGDGWLDGVHVEDVGRCRGVHDTSAQARLPYSIDYRLRCHDGRYRWVMESALPRFVDGVYAGYVGSGLDIDVRKQAEDRLAQRAQTLRESHRRKDDFLSTLAHELRNPLAPIANSAGLLRLIEKDSPRLPRIREIIERQVDQLRRLTSDMVDIARLQQHRLGLKTEPLDVDQLVEAAIDSVQPVLDTLGHSVDIDMPVRGLRIHGDPTRLQQALGHLLANAARFSPEAGRIGLDVRDSEGTLRIIVSDNGEGIASERLAGLFELFARQADAQSKARAGLGIGLTIARRVARLHGGDITASSLGPGQGASFTMSLSMRAPSARPVSG